MSKLRKISTSTTHPTSNSQSPAIVSLGNDVQVLFKQGLALHQQGELVQAQAFYEQVVATQPDHFDALHLLGLTAAQLKNPEMAVSWIARALALQPHHPGPLVGMGLALQELKQWQEALASFDKAIALHPDHAQAHSCRGDALLELGRAQEALLSFEQALVLQPGYVHALFSRASVLHKLGRAEEALHAYDQAIALQPDYPQAYSSRGNVLHEMGRAQEALASYERAIALHPSYVQAHFNRGNALQSLSRLEDALLSYAQVLSLEPGHAAAYSNQGNALLKLGRLDQALMSYERAVAIEPDVAEVFYNRGNALHLLDRDPEAVASYDQAIALRPIYAEAYSNRGNALQQLRRLDEALASYDQALRLKPGYAEASYNRGNALHQAELWEQAVASYQQAIDWQPEQSAFHYNLGNTFKELNRLALAVASYDRATALDPGHAEGHWNKSLALLLDGQLRAGWQLYEWRWKTTNAGFKLRPFAQPLWLGIESLRGKTILLHAEQGLGDTLQFCRYAKPVKALGARVVLEVQEPLRDLLLGLDGVDECVAAGQALPDFDFQCPLLSLPLAFSCDLHTITRERSYLPKPQPKLAHWRARLGQTQGQTHSLRVGLVWSGNPLHQNDRRRSVALADLLSHLPEGLAYVSLQKELREGDLQLLQERGVRSFAEELHDFTDTAALCELVDLVISIDTSVAHLAGALGTPCWVMLPWVPDWRWLLGRDDSPWYASLRLYRQDASRAWAPVLQRVAADLADLARAELPARP
jgi:tetratricopeptide (TPR) repeat protein